VVAALPLSSSTGALGGAPPRAYWGGGYDEDEEGDEGDEGEGGDDDDGFGQSAHAGQRRKHQDAFYAAAPHVYGVGEGEVDDDEDAAAAAEEDGDGYEDGDEGEEGVVDEGAEPEEYDEAFGGDDETAAAGAHARAKRARASVSSSCGGGADSPHSSHYSLHRLPGSSSPSSAPAGSPSALTPSEEDCLRAYFAFAAAHLPLVDEAHFRAALLLRGGATTTSSAPAPDDLLALLHACLSAGAAVTGDKAAAVAHLGLARAHAGPAAFSLPPSQHTVSALLLLAVLARGVERDEAAAAFATTTAHTMAMRLLPCLSASVRVAAELLFLGEASSSSSSSSPLASASGPVARAVAALLAHPPQPAPQQPALCSSLGDAVDRFTSLLWFVTADASASAFTSASLLHGPAVSSPPAPTPALLAALDELAALSRSHGLLPHMQWPRIAGQARLLASLRSGSPVEDVAGLCRMYEAMSNDASAVRLFALVAWAAKVVLALKAVQDRGRAARGGRGGCSGGAAARAATADRGAGGPALSAPAAGTPTVAARAPPSSSSSAMDDASEAEEEEALTVLPYAARFLLESARVGGCPLPPEDAAATAEVVAEEEEEEFEAANLDSVAALFMLADASSGADDDDDNINNGVSQGARRAPTGPVPSPRAAPTPLPPTVSIIVAALREARAMRAASLASQSPMASSSSSSSAQSLSLLPPPARLLAGGGGSGRQTSLLSLPPAAVVASDGSGSGAAPTLSAGSIASGADAAAAARGKTSSSSYQLTVATAAAAAAATVAAAASASAAAAAGQRDCVRADVLACPPSAFTFDRLGGGGGGCCGGGGTLESSCGGEAGAAAGVPRLRFLEVGGGLTAVPWPELGW
jgi:hypothetical protein